MLLSVPSLKYVRGLYSGHNLSLEQLSKVVDADDVRVLERYRELRAALSA